MLICIDPGHAKSTAGKRSFDGSLLEYEFNRAVARLLKDYLERHGVKTMYSCNIEADEDTSLAVRCRAANYERADLFVSLHANAYGTGWNSANGWEIYYYSGSTNGKRLAEAIHRTSIPFLELRDRGVRTYPYTVLTDTAMPAVLIEHGFYTNLEECGKLKSSEFRRKCALADTRGILSYLGIAWKEEECGNAEVLKNKVGLADETIEYLQAYKYGDELVRKLADAVKG